MMMKRHQEERRLLGRFLVMLFGLLLLSIFEYQGQHQVVVEAAGLFGGGSSSTKKNVVPWVRDNNHGKNYMMIEEKKTNAGGGWCHRGGYGFHEFGCSSTASSSSSSYFALFRGGETTTTRSSVGKQQQQQQQQVSPLLSGAAGVGKTSNNNNNNDYDDVFVCVSTVNWGEFQQQQQQQQQHQQDQQPSKSSSSELIFTPGCRLLHSASGSNVKDWIGKGLWRSSSSSSSSNSGPLWKSLAFLSDILILNIYQRQPINEELVQALEAGFAARLNDLPKSRLLIVLHCNNPYELKQWKTALREELSSAVPGILQEIEIVDCKSYYSTFDRMKKRVLTSSSSSKNAAAGICRLVDTKAYPALFRQVYRAFGGGGNKIYVGDLLKQQSEDLVTEVKQQQQDTTIAATSTNYVLDEDDIMIERELINLSNELIDEIQIKQEEMWLGNGIPINFAGVVNPRLTALSKVLRSKDIPDVVRTNVVQHVQERIEKLYLSQLESLREQYGKMYEAMLDKLTHSSSSKDNNGKPTITDDDTDAWKDAAARVSDKFRKASQHAVPALCQPGKLFGYDSESGSSSEDSSKWTYYQSLTESGLISDMMEATELRYDDLDVLEEDDFISQQRQRQPYSSATDASSTESSSSSTTQSKTSRRNRNKLRLRKWHERLLARAFVIGVNYLQGWLAWQGIKHAALLREQQMPKFPLF